MKKILAHSLVLLLVLTSFLVVPVFSPDTDAVSAATTWTEAPAAPAAPAAPSTPSKPSSPASVSPSIPAGAGTYVVVSGDTMAKIAAKYNMTLDKLAALNPQIKNVSLIYVGQKVVVSAGSSTSTAATAVTTGKKVYEGMGYKVSFRNGPGADSTGTPVYSFNIAMARATFDTQGRILDVYIDGYEVATPNYDGASMPHFSGWPSQAGINVTDHLTASVSGISVNTLESATAEVNAWLSKRQRGDSYEMNPANEWYKQMDFYQNFFKGKTVAELEAWFAKYTTTAGRPIKSSTTNAADLAKYNKLTSAEKADLADVVSGATMSLRDAHGDFLGAVGDAYKNSKEITITEK